MNRKKIGITTLMVLGTASLLSLIGYFLALNDIAKDYVSPALLQQLNISASSLPNWTQCQGEWKLIQLGFLPMLVFHITALGGIIWYIKQK